MFVKQKHGLIL